MRLRGWFLQAELAVITATARGSLSLGNHPGGHFQHRRPAASNVDKFTVVALRDIDGLFFLSLFAFDHNTELSAASCYFQFCWRLAEFESSSLILLSNKGTLPGFAPPDWPRFNSLIHAVFRISPP